MKYSSKPKFQAKKIKKIKIKKEIILLLNSIKKA